MHKNAADFLKNIGGGCYDNHKQPKIKIPYKISSIERIIEGINHMIRGGLLIECFILTGLV